ncbi:MAG: hypothetical protein PWP08_751 [Methanofollis sp.]|nr:hypothetical protein [Methanofollis sp.]
MTVLIHYPIPDRAGDTFCSVIMDFFSLEWVFDAPGLIGIAGPLLFVSIFRSCRR